MENGESFPSRALALLSPPSSRLSPPMERPPAYLPNELLLQILSYIPSTPESQSTLHAFTLVCRQWYRVGIADLYACPHLTGHAFDLFFRTICPSLNLHVRKSALATLVKVLDLSYIVHQGSKSMTARLLGRTKPSLEKFIAPQAGFAINCWAALSKCSNLRYLNLSLVSEAISYQSLTKTVRALDKLEELYLPRCSANYDNMGQLSMNVVWPKNLRHLTLSGGVHGKYIYDLYRQPENFPPSLTRLDICHCPKLEADQIRSLLQSLGHQLLHVELHSLPRVRPCSLTKILDWVPGLKELAISLDFISEFFGGMPENFSPAMWAQGKPLEVLTVLTDGNYDTENCFTPVDLFEAIDSRWFTRLRVLRIEVATGWMKDMEGEVRSVENLMLEIDEENFYQRRWHYGAEGLIPPGTRYEIWMESKEVREKWRPRIEVVRWT